MNKEFSALEEEFKRLAKCVQEQERLAIVVEDCMINIPKILNSLKDKINDSNK